MWKLLDRQMFFGFLKSYFVCLVSLLSLFIVVDLFTNLDDFSQATDHFPTLVRYISTYYAYNSVKIFDRLSEAIVLLAAMFTVALMQRNNELLPLLSAGVSTRRVVAPVIGAAFLMILLGAANQELIMPRIDAFVIENRNNPTGEREIEVGGAFDINRNHVSGRVAIRKDLLIKDFHLVFPEKQGQDGITSVGAREARWIPPVKGDKFTGGWLLAGAAGPDLDHGGRSDVLEPVVPGKIYFFRTDELDFDRVTRAKNWHYYMPTWGIFEEMNKTDTNRNTIIAVIFHMRLTRPFVGAVLVLMGLSVILRDQNRNVFISAGMCLILCGVFFAACFSCQSLGNSGTLTPLFAAWLPLLVFGPLALVMFFDTVHT